MAKLSIFTKFTKGANEISFLSSQEHTIFNGKRFAALFEHHPHAVFAIDLDGRVVNHNKSAKSMLGYTKNNKTWDLDSYFHEDSKILRIKYYQLALEGKAQNYQATLVHKGGHLIEVDLTYIPVLDKEMKVMGLFVIARDITEFATKNNKVITAVSKFELAQKVVKMGSWDYDLETHKAYYSKQMLEMTGRKENEDVIPLRVDGLKYIHRKDRERYMQALTEALENRSGYGIEYRLIHFNGDILSVSEQVEIILDEEGKPTRLVGVTQDITKRKLLESKFEENEKQIIFLAYHDSLTGLPNRTQFNGKIEALIERARTKGQTFSVMYLDLDRFRNINSSLGYAVADKFLQHFSKRIQSILSEKSLLARIGVDEFGILLWDYEHQTFPEALAKTIIDSLNVPFLFDEFELYTSASVGISTYPMNGQNAEELLKNANAALFRAKANGNSYQIYSTSLDIASYKQYDLDKDLRKAIERNQLLIFFQPRVEASTGRLVCAEALIRWEHPVWGLVSPSEFIPLAEETGFINEIGDWVLKQACQFIANCKKENLPVVPISVNISAQRFLRNDWKEMIIETIKQANIDPKFIELEITETTLIQHESVIETAFQFLNLYGIKIALDDFGTGYSSLSHIKNFSIHTLKIDQSFTQKITEDANVEMIIKSLIYMAKGLNMNIVAEGVETLEQLAFLKQQDCHEIQGYIFSKPVPEETFRALVKKGILKPQLIRGKSELINRRKYYRLDLLFPLIADMTLLSIKEKQVKLGKTEVIIDNIGPGGIRFLSTMQLPIRPDIIYQFETIMLHQDIKLNGHIVWKEEVKGQYLYGVQFILKEQERDFLMKIFNNVSIQLKNNPFPPGYRFLKEDKWTFLRKE